MALAWDRTYLRGLTLSALNVLARTGWLVRTTPPSEGAQAGAMRLLVLELGNIGDLVLTLPFLARLRALFPGATTTLLARPHAKEVLAGTGLVDEFIEIELATANTRLFGKRFASDWRAVLRVCGVLRECRFDLAFQCRMHIREHLILAQSGARRRIGYGFGFGDHLLTDAITVHDPDRHKAADWLGLLEGLGGADPVGPALLRVTDSERLWGAEYLSANGVATRDTLIGVHPGASVAGKRWLLRGFHDVTAALAGRAGVRVVAFVDPEGYGDSLGEIPGVIRAQVGLRQLIALTERCQLLICNDSGPMHLAGALGVPTVSLFAAGIDRWFSPLGEGHQFVTADVESVLSNNKDRPGAPRGLDSIPSKRVLDAVERALDRSSSNHHDPARPSRCPPANRMSRDSGRGR